MTRRVIFFCALFAPLLIGRGQAQIRYSDITPDVELNSWDFHDIRIDSSAAAQLPQGAFGSLSIWNDFGTQIDINAFGDCEVLTEGGYPSALAKDAPITESGAWAAPAYAMLNSGSGQGNWIGVVDRYLGVRIRENGQWLYGWIRMDVNAAGTSVTIKDYACNMTPGAAITAGQTILSAADVPSAAGRIHADLYPNPATASLRIRLSMDVPEADFVVLDALGRTLRSERMHGSVITFNRGSLNAGVYAYVIFRHSTPIARGSFVVAD